MTPGKSLTIACFAALIAAAGCSPSADESSARSAPAASPFDERHKVFGDYEIHFNAMRTDDLTPDVARSYSITRSKSRGMVTVVIRKRNADGTTTAATGNVVANTRNLTGQLKNVTLRKVTEGDAIYYIGDLPVANREVLIFDIDVTPDGQDETFGVKFQQQFFTD